MKNKLIDTAEGYKRWQFIEGAASMRAFGDQLWITTLVQFGISYEAASAFVVRNNQLNEIEKLPRNYLLIMLQAALELKPDLNVKAFYKVLEDKLEEGHLFTPGDISIIIKGS